MTAFVPGAILAPRWSPGRCTCSQRSSLDGLATALVRGLWRELLLTPKPGLVDLDDEGSHPDLSIPLMARSIALVEAYLADEARSLATGEPLAAQVALARAAEHRMRAQLGTNTHKGAVFLGGLLLAARARAACDEERSVRDALGLVAREVVPLLAVHGTNGAVARARHGVGGILREAGAGLPSVFEAALPAFRAAVMRGETSEAQSYRMLAQLMWTVEDTTALHRRGIEGLAILRADGARLDAVLDAGGASAAAAFLRARNAAYRAMNLTMGGVADLLGVAYGWLVWRGELPER